MTPNQFRTALDRLGLSQAKAAEMVNANPRTARSWALGQSRIPESVAILLRLLVAGKITISDVERARK